MPPPPDRLFAVAAKCLAVLQAGYATAGVDLPERQFVAPGIAIYDREQLVVQVERTYSIQGNVAGEVIADQNTLGMRSATLAITLLRCVPTQAQGGKPPTAAKDQAAAAELLTDAHLLWNILRAAYRAGQLEPYNHGLAFDSWQGLGPDGGLGGGVLRVRWALAASPMSS